MEVEQATLRLEEIRCLLLEREQVRQKMSAIDDKLLFLSGAAIARRPDRKTPTKNDFRAALREG